VARTFRIAFIGAGGIALTHIKHLKAVDGVEVVAAADISEKSLNRARDQHSIPRLYADYRKMLAEEKDLDAVSVCTPNALHAENAIAALEAGRHVLVEKPMAMNAAECRRMVEAARKADRRLVVGFQYRFDARSAMLRRQIEAGEFGRILYVRCQALRRRGIPNWGVFGRKDLQGGGPLIDIGVHVLEMAHYMVGSPRPLAATGKTWTYIGNRPCDVACNWPNWDYKTYSVEDLAAGLVRLEGGAMLSIEASFAAHIEKDVWNVQIMGEKGGAVWEPVQVFRDCGGYMVNQTPFFTGKVDPFEAKMRHFVEVCRDGRPCIATGEHGLMVQQMIDAIYASSEAGREVPVE